MIPPRRSGPLTLPVLRQLRITPPSSSPITPPAYPDEILYVVDKRQELHFIQVFRCARKTGLVEDDTKLSFLGFGTMNGKDGKPFKTREGGVMRLENLIADIDEEMFNKIVENRSVRDKDAKDTAKIVGLAAIKYGDLSNQATKDYIFDVDQHSLPARAGMPPLGQVWWP